MNNTNLIENLPILDMLRVDDNLYADKNMKLHTISRFNLIGRLIKWIRDWKKDEKGLGNETRKVLEATKCTLQMVNEINQRLNEKVYFKFTGSKEIGHYHFPASNLKDITKNKTFKNDPVIASLFNTLKASKKSYPIQNILRDKGLEYFVNPHDGFKYAKKDQKWIKIISN
jgi:hypothetical protein